MRRKISPRARRLVERACALAWRCTGLQLICARNDGEVTGGLRTESGWPAIELVYDQDDALYYYGLGHLDQNPDHATMVCETLNLPGARFTALAFVDYTPADVRPQLHRAALEGLTETALHRLVRLQLGSRARPFVLAGPIFWIPAPNMRHLELHLGKWWKDARYALSADDLDIDEPNLAALAFPRLRSLMLDMASSGATRATCKLVHELPHTLRTLNVDLSAPLDGDSARWSTVKNEARLAGAKLLDLLASEIVRKLNEDPGQLTDIAVVPMPASSYAKLDADRQPILTFGGSSTWTQHRDAAIARLAAACARRGVTLSS